MEVIDGSVQGWNKFDESMETVLNWTDMLNDSAYCCELIFDHNRAPNRTETLRIFHKYYRGRNRNASTRGTRV